MEVLEDQRFREYVTSSQSLGIVSSFGHALKHELKRASPDQTIINDCTNVILSAAHSLAFRYNMTNVKSQTPYSSYQDPMINTE